MYDFFNVLVILASIVDVVLSECCDLKKEDYVSLESGELAGINDVVDSVSQDNDGNKMSTRGDFKNITVSQSTTDIQNTSKISGLLPIKNVASSYLNCGWKTTSSSEESLCKSTLINYPYAASIQKKGAHYATGALINAKSLLTAAGVFYHVRESIKLFRVRLGSVDHKTGGVLLPIQRVHIHPSYKHGNPEFDLALIKLGWTLQFTDYIKPIPLSRIKHSVVSAKFMTTYWPRLIVDGIVIPKTAKERVKDHSMRVSTQSMIPWKVCADLMKARDTPLGESSLCLKPIAMHHSICMPDVGAPVVAEDGLWGVTSGWISKQCSTNPSPTIVTRTAVPAVRSWLKSVL